MGAGQNGQCTDVLLLCFLQLFADRAVVPSMGLANSQVTAGK